MGLQAAVGDFTNDNNTLQKEDPKGLIMYAWNSNRSGNSIKRMLTGKYKSVHQGERTWN